MPKSKKTRKAYNPNKVKSSTTDTLNAFWRSHESFTTMDNLLFRINAIGKLMYTQGIGYTYKNEEGEVFEVIQALKDWNSEWDTIRTLVRELGLPELVFGNGLEQLYSTLTYRIIVTDRMIESCEQVLAVQRRYYFDVLAVTPKGREIIRTAIKPRQVREEIQALIHQQ